MKLNKAISADVWRELGFPPGWGGFQPEVLDTLQFVVALPNGVAAEALIAERQGSPGFVANASVGAVAGQNSYVRLLNPGTSGLDLLVDQVTVARGGWTTESFSLRTGAAAGVILANGATNKEIGGAAPSAEVYTGTSAAVGGTFRAHFMPQAPGLMLADPFVLPPGADLSVVCEAVNTGWNVSIFFRAVAA